MTNVETGDSPPRKSLRVWPGIVVVVLQWLAWFVVPFLFPRAALYALLVGVICAGLIILWWLFFSRAPWLERVGALALIVIAIVATKRVVHPSIAGGTMGWWLYIFSMPVLALALVAGAAFGRRLSGGTRRAVLAGAILLGCGVFTLLRTGGISGVGELDLHFRWTKTPEERLLAQAGNEPITVPVATTGEGSKTELGWPGFRGSKRDGIVSGVRINTDWSQKPPVALWRKPVGPAWSSFAVQGNLVYTQEQRGDKEVVSCYDLTTGKPVWQHGDAVRFYESNAGAGPRGTPTLSNGRVYTFGATGILNVLDARNGSVVWSRNAATDTKTKTPHWGFAGSPLLIDDIVIVAAAGSLAAYDIATGNPRWVGPTSGGGYSSPHLLTIAGVTQILFVSGEGVTGVSPKDGRLLWKHAWAGDAIVQPAATADGDILIGSGSGLAEVGLLRVAVQNGSGGWTTQARWRTYDLNPYFNDFVVHKDHVYGFEGSTLACIDLKNGTSKWTGGSYGTGQLILLADQDLLMVISEKGELVLVRATPEQFSEIARFKAIEGKTWNHPVLVGDVLLVRNSEEMAAFRLVVESK